MAKEKYPNPKFFRMKDKMDWKRQAENVAEIAEICKEIARETDWKAAGAKHLKGWKDFGLRVADEARAVGRGSIFSLTEKNVWAGSIRPGPWPLPAESGGV